MRFIGLLLVLMLVGAAAGVALGKARFARIAAPDQSGEIAVSSEGERRPLPQAEVSELEYDFGTLSLAATGEHRFVIRNKGNALLRLEPGETSCKCTLSRIERRELSPGEDSAVIVQFKGLEEPGPYQQSATVLTNDPGRPRIVFTITGKMVASLQLKPKELVFSQISSSEPAVGHVRLFAYDSSKISITGWEVAGSGGRGQFECRWAPLSPQEIGAEADARAGFLIEVTVKPGLPSGTFERTIRLTTDDPAAPSIDLPVRGQVVNDINVVGPGWNAEYNLLDLGTVNRRQGLRRTLLLVVRGPGRDAVRFDLAEVVPPMLRVELGTPRAINNGAAYQTPLTIEIPPGSPTISLTGPRTDRLGRLSVRTTHPTIPEVRLLISLTIEE